jgi:hypothetical protein
MVARRAMKRLLVVCPVVLSMWACDKSPARVELEVPGYVMSGKEVALNTRVETKGGDLLPDVRPTFAVNPPELAVVTASGGLRCLKSGNGTLTATAGTITRSESLRCRLVESLRLPKSVRLIIPNEPVALEASARDATGKVLEDVPFNISSSNPSVFGVQGGMLAPAAVGAAELTVTVGEKTATVPVTVVRKLKAEPLLLNDGNRVSWSLNQGNYEIEAKVRAADGSRHGVTVAWVGGSGCRDESEAQQLQSRCTIENTGSVIIENPTTFGMGPAADGVVAMYEVP